MSDVKTLLTEWEAEILLLETALWQATTQFANTLTKRERQQLERQLRVARQSQTLLYGLAGLVEPALGTH